MEPTNAVLGVGCAGLLGAVVTWACTTSRPTSLLRAALVVLRATPI
ncbi:hypothetical protein OIB37_02185 [Streptomyces sp. NBC_00820]|nr:hypothetical protein OIB37_02185 [Streptomyces sp. NBC_00820]